MNSMEDIHSIILIGTGIMLTLTIILFIFKLNKIERKYNTFISKFNDKNSIEETLNNYIQLVKRVNEDNKIIHANCLNLERQLQKCNQRVGLVRYNAFDDVGSDLSFALAVLDNENNGFVLNAIYARTSNNIYAKPIENGTSRYELSEEEIKAVSKAKDSEKM